MSKENIGRDRERESIVEGWINALEYVLLLIKQEEEKEEGII